MLFWKPTGPGGPIAPRGACSLDFEYRGINYLTICDATTGEEGKDAAVVAAGIRSVITVRILTELMYQTIPAMGPIGKHWYYMRAIRIPTTDPVQVVVSHEEITALKLTEQALRDSQEKLNDQKQGLEEANVALKVLLKQREEDKRYLEKRFLTNVKGLVLPYVEKF